MINKTVLLAGGSGLIGKKLYQYLLKNGYEPIILSRDKKLSERKDFIYWDPDNQSIDIHDNKTVFAIINLCGAGIADKKWTKERKTELIESRTKPAHLLADLIRQGKLKTTVYLGASAIGIYGNRSASEICKESDKVLESSFLSKCCLLWEEAHGQIPDHVRKVTIRIGILLAGSGGILDQYTPLLQLRMAPFFGGGKPIMSWITIDDLCRMIIFCIEHEQVTGTFNAAADHPVNSKEFAIAFIKRQPKWVLVRRVPDFAVKLMLGELSTLVLEGQFVSNEKIKNTGFSFISHTIDEAFEAIKQ